MSNNNFYLKSMILWVLKFKQMIEIWIVTGKKENHCIILLINVTLTLNFLFYENDSTQQRINPISFYRKVQWFLYWNFRNYSFLPTDIIKYQRLLSIIEWEFELKKNEHYWAYFSVIYIYKYLERVLLNFRRIGYILCLRMKFVRYKYKYV